MSTVTITTILFIAICIDIIGLALIATWIYKDAKAREMNPWGWIALTCLLSPNFIGLIAYLLCRRKDTEVECMECEKPVNPSMSYCPWCGTENKWKNKSLPSKPTYHLLVTGVVIMIACTILMLTIIFTAFPIL